MRNLCRFTIPIIGIAVSLAGIGSAAAQQPPIMPPQIVSSGDVSIQEGDFSNPNFTLFNPNSVPVTFGGESVLFIGITGDPDDFAVVSVPQTGSCFFGFPNNPFTLGPKPATGNGPANSCDFDLHVSSTLDGDENNDTGVSTYAITAGWTSGQTSTINFVVEVRDPGAPTTILEPATLTLALLGMATTLILSRRRKPMQKD